MFANTRSCSAGLITRTEQPRADQKPSEGFDRPLIRRRRRRQNATCPVEKVIPGKLDSPLFRTGDGVRSDVADVSGQASVSAHRCGSTFVEPTSVTMQSGGTIARQIR